MQIEIDFDVFKELTARRHSETDSYNEVIRRLLNLPSINLTPGLRDLAEVGHSGMSRGLGGKGIWFSNVFFGDGTKFRATYKGRTYLAEIKDGRWVGQDGIERTSPSDAASSISGTNVNGWRFWFAKRPQDLDWVRMDEFRQ